MGGILVHDTLWRTLLLWTMLMLLLMLMSTFASVPRALGPKVELASALHYLPVAAYGVLAASLGTTLAALVALEIGLQGVLLRVADQAQVAGAKGAWEATGLGGRWPLRAAKGACLPWRAFSKPAPAAAVHEVVLQHHLACRLLRAMLLHQCHEGSLVVCARGGIGLILGVRVEVVVVFRLSLCRATAFAARGVTRVWW